MPHLSLPHGQVVHSQKSLKDKIELTGTDEDELFIGINNYFRKLALRQIRMVFEQSQKEVDDLRPRISEGLKTAQLNNKRVGTPKGTKLITKKSLAAKEIIKKHSKDFDGTLDDADVIKLAGISRNSFYKYKREIRNSL